MSFTQSLQEVSHTCPEDAGTKFLWGSSQAWGYSSMFLMGSAKLLVMQCMCLLWAVKNENHLGANLLSILLQAHYGTLLRLKQYFPFSLIDAMGTMDECRQQINREMRYQSSMDLDETTYAAIRHLPLAKELVRTSRQQLVSHLDSYSRKHTAVFEKVSSQQSNLFHFVLQSASCRAFSRW